MKTVMLYSKHDNRGSLLRQSLILAGAFILLGTLAPTKAHAIGEPLDNGKDTVLTTPQTNSTEIKELEDSFVTKKELIEEKQEAVEAIVKHAEEVADVKESLQAKVDAQQAEIDELKAKIAEKRRIEALRIVQIKSYADNADGNTYAWGNCTYYVKTKRPDIGNLWGDAHSWYRSAQNAGFKTGTQSKTGAIGVSFGGRLGHVVYVEKWYNDGTILISEMNYEGLNVVSQRVANESDFVYIYEKP